MIHDPRVGPYASRMPLAPRVPANQRSASGVEGFHTMHSGIDPMSHRFRARFVGPVDVWK